MPPVFLYTVCLAAEGARDDGVRSERGGRRPDAGLGEQSGDGGPAAAAAAVASADTRFFVAVFVFRNFLPVFFGRLQRAGAAWVAAAPRAAAAA